MPAAPGSVVQEAADLRTAVTEHAGWSAANRRQHPEVARALAGAGLHRLAVAEEVGGAGVDPMTMIRAIEQVAAADGSAGWSLMIGIECLGVASGWLDQGVASRLLAERPDTIIAGALIPLGTAVPEGDGYRVSGRWPFASGIHTADWWWGGCVVDDGSGVRPRPAIQVLVPRSELTIHDTWHATGLAGTGSHDVEVLDTLVPAELTTDVLNRPPSGDDPLVRMPVMCRLAFNKVGVSTGIARGAIDDFVELATAKVPRGSRSSLAERPRAQLAVAEAEAALGGGRAWALEVVEELWDHAVDGRPVDAKLHARVRLACASAAQAAVTAVGLVHSAAGTSPNQVDNPLGRRFRDVHVVPQQITVAPHMIDTAGRVLLGLDSGLDLF